MIHAFCPPAEKLFLALIQVCVAEIWAGPKRLRSHTEPFLARNITTVGLRPRSGSRPTV
jgi:hypothetical protein